MSSTSRYQYHGSTSSIPYEKMDYPKPDVHVGHPLKDPKSHQRLMDYLMPRIEKGLMNRDGRVERMTPIDKAVSCWMRLSAEDKERKIKQENTGIPQATLTNLPLTFVHLDDFVTYFCQTFSPNKGMFYNSGKPDEVDAANQITLLMNNHAIYGGYYRQMFQGFWAMHKYNLGGFRTNWGTDYGPKVSFGAEGAVSSTQEKIWAGNRMLALDMYNTFWDPAVEPCEVYQSGEFAGHVHLRSHYWLSQKCLDNVYFNCEEELNQPNLTGHTCQFFVHPPTEASALGDDSRPGNWATYLSDAPDGLNYPGFELIEVQIRINPTWFNLVPPGRDKAARNRYEIWKFTILNGRKIIETTHMNNVHNHLAYYMGSVNDDGMGQSQKSPAETLMPFQTFASHVMNIHIQGTRRNLFGLTFYDPTVVDMSQIPEGEVVGRIPTKPIAAGKKVEDHIFETTSNFDAEGAMPELERVLGIVAQFFPTQSLPSQISGIDRAVSNQVTAVQQGVSRRQQKNVTLVDSSCLRPMRFSLFFNILQYQPDGEDITDFRGRKITVNLSKIRNTDMLFIIGMGLKAIDRQMIADKLQQVIFALIQNPNSAAQTDVLAMIDYWTDMLDIDVDMNQFRIQSPAQAGVEAPGAAAGAEVPAEGTGVTPMTAPGAVTEPLMG